MLNNFFGGVFMNYFTSDTYVLKRQIVKFAYLMTRNCRNVDSNLVLDIIYVLIFNLFTPTFSHFEKIKIAKQEKMG